MSVSECVFHTELFVCSVTKWRETSHEERANQTLALWIYARVFRFVRL